MKIIITEEQKKKLFIPRKLSGEDSRWNDWNNKQPMRHNRRINQYDESGRKEGYWEEYHDNGQLYSNGVYVYGDREGYWEFYFYTGELMLKGKFEDNKRMGIWVKYYKNGGINYSGEYLDDMKHGVFTNYDENGDLKEKIIYHYDNYTWL